MHDAHKCLSVALNERGNIKIKEQEWKKEREEKGGEKAQDPQQETQSREGG